jgi:hypothetical protein
MFRSSNGVPSSWNPTFPSVTDRPLTRFWRMPFTVTSTVVPRHTTSHAFHSPTWRSLSGGWGPAARVNRPRGRDDERSGDEGGVPCSASHGTGHRVDLRHPFYVLLRDAAERWRVSPPWPTPADDPARSATATTTIVK